ncbi:MAG: DUF2997 domain-containing protein [Planctomycetota bacterium]|jgi:hypothetical protein
MPQHEVEIVVSKDGQVKVHIKGAKGKACMAYAKWLTQLIGKVDEQQLTSEYYEPEIKSKIDIHQELEIDE